jgi:hypothetical protein
MLAEVPDPLASTWWLQLPDGSRRRIEPSGCLLGRAADCDVVLVSQDASRRQALVYLGAEGPHVVAMGRAATLLDGTPVETSRPCVDGSRVEVPGLQCTLLAEPVSSRDEEPSWVLERVGGAFFGVGERPLTIGGGSDDGLRIAGLPAHALGFRVVSDRLVVEFGVDGTIDGRSVAAGAVEGLRPGSRIGAGDPADPTHGIALRVIDGGRQHDATTRGVGGRTLEEHVTQVALEFLPHGGRLRLTTAGRERSLYLADRRCDLVACLLQPPAPLNPGEFVPDDVLLPRVWPGKPADRTAINVLVHRLRRDLVRAGIDGCALVERSAGGGATRFTLGRGASVEVR